MRMNWKGQVAFPLAAGFLLAGPLCQGQTAVDLKSQARNVDFSQAASTKPSKMGSTLPVACALGETFFLTTAASGQNLYGCTAPNTWNVMSGAGSANQIGGNSVASGAASVTGEFYAWDPADSKLKLYKPGNLFSFSGTNVNVATESVLQYGSGPTIPPTCGQYGLIFFKTDSGENAKLHYCNGSTYELAGGSVIPAEGPFAPFGMAGTGTAFAATLANRVFLYMFLLPQPLTFSRFSFNASTATAGGKAAFAIYDANRQKLMEGTAADLSTTGGKSSALSASATLPAGRYYIAYAASETSVASTFLSISPTLTTILNLSAQRVGFCSSTANLTLALGNQFPATCTMTLLASNSTLPLVLMEP